MFIETRIFTCIYCSIDQHETIQDLLKTINDQFIT